MKSEEEREHHKQVMTGIIIGILGGYIAGALSAVSMQNDSWEYQAVQHNAAHYDPKTGEWQ